MDLKELAEALQLIGVPPDLIELGGARENAFGIVQAAADRWEVSWSGNQRQAELYSAAGEAAACYLLLGRVGATWLTTIAGTDGNAIPPGVSAGHPAVQAILPAGYDPYARQGRQRWERTYWPGNATDARGRPRLRWPDDAQHPDGFATAEDRKPIVLEPGSVVDQFGPGFSRLVYPSDTPFPQRSLPPDYLDAGYHQYRLIRRVPVWAGPVAPAFGQAGGGMQYFMLEATIDLVNRGYLEELDLGRPDPDRPHRVDGGQPPGEDLGPGVEALRRTGAYDDVLSLAGPGEQAWCVERTGSSSWTVYWSERGHPMADDLTAGSPQAAGHVLVGRLILSRLLAGGGWWGDQRQ